MFDPRSTEFKRAVSNIQFRAERDSSEESLALAHVDADFMVRLHNRSNQIVVGRRGTGKTHLFLALKNLEELRDSSASFLYIDVSRLHTAAIGPGSPPQRTADEYFLRVLGDIEIHLTDLVCQMEAPPENVVAASHSAWDSLTATFAKPRDENTGIFRYERLRAAIERLLEALGTSHLMLLLDEWVKVPWDAQPYFADHLRQLVVPSKRLSMKIAAIQFRSNFNHRDGHSHVGFELGPDVSCDIDMDSYLVMDKDEDHVVRFFAQLLFNHLAVRMGCTLPPMSPEEKEQHVIQDLFTQRSTFVELVRAGEGVARDFLNIFALTYFECYLPKTAAGRDRIDVKAVRRAAQEWYSKDKFAAIQSSPELQGLLGALITRVIGEKEARSFMVCQRDSHHPLLQQLFDSRVIHLLKRSWSHQDMRGERFDIFTIDYGTYVDLITTAKEPQLFLFEDDVRVDPADVIVPFDDGRSIRRITLERDLMDRFCSNGSAGSM